MNPIGKDISAWSEILSVNPSLVEWTRTDPLSLSQDIIRTDKVTYPSAWPVAIIHGTLPASASWGLFHKNSGRGTGGQFYGCLVSGGGSDVRLVGFVRASASKLLLGTRPNDWAGAVPEEIVVELDFVKEDLSHEIQIQMGHGTSEHPDSKKCIVNFLSESSLERLRKIRTRLGDTGSSWGCF